MVAVSPSASAAAVKEVKDIRPGPLRSKPRRMVEYRGQVYFDANDGVHGTELWRTDGTGPGTELAVDVVPGEGSSSPTGPIVSVDDKLLFAAGPSDARAVYASDGTPLGTTPITGSDGFPFAFVPAQERAFFRVFSGTNTALWTSDGTPSGTEEVHRFSESSHCPLSNASPDGTVTVAGRLAFFCAYDAEHGDELWRTDGTVAGTQIAADLVEGPVSSSPISLTAFGDDVALFISRDGQLELWSSDGTASGTVQATKIPTDQRVGPIAVSGSRLFFISTTADGSVLWSSDGTPSGTAQLSLGPYAHGGDLTPGPAGSVFYSAYEKRTGDELWRSDGTAAGTRLVKDIAPGRGRRGFGPSSAPGNLTPGSEGELYFTAIAPTRGRELWQSDGTRRGTRILGEVRPGKGRSGISEITPIGKTVYFAAQTPRHGDELWIARDRSALEP
jgi:ELWxxDGT repeat protein